MDKQIELSLSVDYYTSKPKNIAQIRYKRRTFTQNSLMVVLGTGYCVAHCFQTQNEIFTQSEKTNDNFEYTQMIGIDIDDCQSDMETFIKRLEKKPTFAYTTFSNGIKGNRFRMIYLFNQKIDSIPLYKAVYNWLTEGLNINDNCMRSVSQQMFGTNFAAKWYRSNIWYDVPHFDESIITNQSAIFKVQNITDKSKCNFQSANSSENQSEEIKVQLLTNQSAKVTKSKCKNQDAILENQSAISDQSAKIKVQKGVSSQISKSFMDDMDSMDSMDFISKYRNCYPYFTATPLHYENGYALIPEDYCEITRPWYREQVGDKAITVVRRLRHGDKRKTHMSNTAVIIRKIKNDITFEHLLYILVCERQYYYDNSDNVLSNKELIKIAQWAMGIPVNELNPKQIKHPKFKVDKAYWREKKNITPKQAVQIVRGQINDKNISELYDCNLTDKENIQIMKDYGIKVSLITLKRWRKKNGITKKVSSQKSKCK